MPKSAGKPGLTTGELAAVGVYGEGTFVGCISFCEERTDFALLHESCIFEAHGHEDGVSIVEFGELHIRRLVTRPLELPWR